ncbi:hypothetical protein MSG28_012540 [Choristoneura fumiferana]|uniref:Uncharacterized protein n=1 Tax=Choristoneura fumiferana TaxID=7141 RepID=A0ACC0JH19_CHOFU|nr:hypothetical protein MSG28_012540 [Choristoneura fumiferana]
MWRAACSVLVCPDADEAWTRISDVAPPDTVWHSLRNCVAYQAGVWQNLLSGGVDDAMQPAAFKLAIVLRHTPTDLVQDLTSYVLALLTDDEAAWCGACGAGSPSGARARGGRGGGHAGRPGAAARPAAVRGLRAGHPGRQPRGILNQFSQIPKLYHTPEFECFEPLARENIDREICTLREHLLTGQHDHE